MAATVQYGFGSGILYGIRNDITNQTPVRFGVLQDVSIEFSAEAKELYGQLQFPVDVARGKAKITGKAKFGQISPLLFNNIYFGQIETVGQKVFAYNEARPFPTSTPWQLTGNLQTGGATFDTDLGPLYAATGTPLTYIPTATSPAPSLGQYNVNASTGVYTFNSGETGSVLLNYTVATTATGNTITGTNLLMGNTPKFQAVFNQTYGGETTTLKLYSCVATKLSMPTKIDDYVIPEIDFSAFANASGSVFELSMTGS